jgi:hypothetical protein
MIATVRRLFAVSAVWVGTLISCSTAAAALQLAEETLPKSGNPVELRGTDT